MDQRTTIHIIDGCSRERGALSRLMFSLGYHAEVYDSIAEFSDMMPDDGVILLNGGDGLEPLTSLIGCLSQVGAWQPIILYAEAPCVSQVVEAMRLGVVDVLECPISPAKLEASLGQISARGLVELRRRAAASRSKISILSKREREVLDAITEGMSNKAIANVLGISPRTVEIHRGNMMTKIGARGSAEAVRVVLESQI